VSDGKKDAPTPTLRCSFERASEARLVNFVKIFSDLKLSEQLLNPLQKHILRTLTEIPLKLFSSRWWWAIVNVPSRKFMVIPWVGCGTAINRADFG
jgi:hypothetical protein